MAVSALHWRTQKAADVFGISREAAFVIVSAIQLQVFLKSTIYGRVASKVVRWLQARWQRLLGWFGSM